MSSLKNKMSVAKDIGISVVATVSLYSLVIVLFYIVKYFTEWLRY